MRYFFLIVTILFPLLFTGYLYAKLRGLSLLLKRPIPRYVPALVALLLVLPLVFRLFSVWTLVIGYLFLCGLAVDLLWLLLKAVCRSHPPVRLQRVYRSFLIPVLITALALGWGWFNIRQVHETVYRVETSKPMRAEGYRVAFVSDLHAGNVPDQLGRAMPGLLAAKPDLVLLGGDIVDESTTKAQLDEAFDRFGSIPAPLGVYYVYGNHDYSLYRPAPYTQDELREALKRNNIRLLDDRLVQAGELNIVGRHDRVWPGRKSLAALGAGRAIQDRFSIMLDHQPVERVANAEAGFDLQLAGHTHDGQIFPMRPILRLFNIMEQIYGREQVGSMTSIVSSGVTGWGFPIRNEGISEYVLVDIVPKK